MLKLCEGRAVVGGSFSARTGRKKDAFITVGYSNWTKAKERFVGHQSSVLHRDAVISQSQRSLVPVATQLSTKKKNSIWRVPAS